MKAIIIVLMIACTALAAGCFALGVQLSKAIAAKDFWQKSSHRNAQIYNAEKKRREAAETLAEKSEEARLASEDVVVKQAEKLAGMNAREKKLCDRMNRADRLIEGVAQELEGIKTNIAALTRARNLIEIYTAEREENDAAERRKEGKS